MQEPKTKKPMSPRKWKAVLMNLAKARRTPRSPASYARSRRNATRHGLFVRHLEGSFVPLGENPARFRKLAALIEQRFQPADVTEKRLVRKLTEAVWRHLRVYPAAAGWTLQALTRSLGPPEPVSPRIAAALGPQPPPGDPTQTFSSAFRLFQALTSDARFQRRLMLTLNEIERTLRLLLIYRNRNPKCDFHISGRRYASEITELSEDPRNWPRRYAAAVPVK
ncbi:MAG TPA: hypothetical protein VFM21_01810 [Terriglobia bacterium]|nr:hypothetical protein [Terriglobia bacterium]